MADTTVVILAPGAGTGRRVPVLACADALRAGAAVEIVEIAEPADLDPVLAAALPGGTADPARGDVRLVVAGDDLALALVLRRMVRRVRPASGDRTGLRDDRTVPDLPPLGVLPLDIVTTSEAGTARTTTDAAAGPDLAGQLGLPRRPAEVAAAVLGGRVRRLDLLRTDAGGVTVHGAVLGAADPAGLPVPFRSRVEVDDKVLSAGNEPVLAVTVANAGGYAEIGGVQMVPSAVADDGSLHVAVAVPITVRSGPLRRRVARVEVRRVRGRAVAVAVEGPDPLPYNDDGAVGSVVRKRTWWIERGAWAVYLT
jgi:hypothetical protein